MTLGVGNSANIVSNTSGNNGNFNYRSVYVLCFALVQHKLLGQPPSAAYFYSFNAKYNDMAELLVLFENTELNASD